jgi:hypothetical protein
MSFKVDNINDLELVYSILREKHPNKQINITFNYNTKNYVVKVSDTPYTFDPDVPLDLKIEVVYGDSVTGDTPIILRDPKTKEICIKTIDSISTQWIDYPEFKIMDTSVRLEKQYSLTDYEVWCDKGWNPIKKVIRHKTNKKIYRVLTHTGVVDVTEDHSLIRTNYEKVKPKDLKVGEDLLHSFPNKFPENEVTMVRVPKFASGTTKLCTNCKIEKDTNEFFKNARMKSGLKNNCKECMYYKKYNKPVRNVLKDYPKKDYPLTEDEARVWGFFVGDGSAGYYHCKLSPRYSWALNNNDMKRLEKYKEILERVEPMKFKILDTLRSSGVYKLVPSGSIKYMVEKYRNLFYEVVDANEKCDKYKIIPTCILNASLAIRKAFFEGYYDADGAKTFQYSIKNPAFATKGKISAQCLYYLTKSIGFDMSLNLYNHPKKLEMYRMDKTTFQRRRNTEIKKIIEKPDTTIGKFVYDLETEKGIFGCGVGEIQAVNTDSIMCMFKYNRDDFEKNRIDTFKLATVCADKLTNDVFNRPPIVLEFEKVFQPFILLTKKRYIANKYENMDNPFQLKGLDAKGIALTRRDYCPMVKKCYKEVINAIMNREVNPIDAIHDSIKIFKSYISKIDKYDIEIEQLVVSAMLAKDYKTRPVHVILAEKLKARKEQVAIGDRIPYIFIESSDPKAQKSELGEDPKYAVEHNLKFNRSCYLEQLAKPLLGFFKVCLNEYPNILEELINDVNIKLEKYGAKKLKPSDFKIE